MALTTIGLPSGSTDLVLAYAGRFAPPSTRTASSSTTTVAVTIAQGTLTTTTTPITQTPGSSSSGSVFVSQSPSTGSVVETGGGAGENNDETADDSAPAAKGAAETSIQEPGIERRQGTSGQQAQTTEPQANVPTAFETLTAGTAPSAVALQGGFVLYLPFSVTVERNVTWSSLLNVLTTPYPGYAPSGASNLAALQLDNGTPVPIITPVVSLAANSAIYIPITNALTTSLAVVDGISALRTAALAIPTDQNDAGTDSPDPTPGGESVPDEKSTSYSAGALAGGMIGAFIAAVLVCGLIAFFCIRRRRSRRFRSDARSSGSSNDYALADMARNPEKSQAAVAASSVTGWQKHLPQEKDDGTITKLFKSIFEQTQMHMEGYYVSNPQDLSDASIATLRELSEDDLPLMLPQTQKQVLLLEGILLRFMIHRVSGRSDVQDSFLPGDLSRIAKNNGWYMERESGQSGVATSGKKRGFSQALAQWRQLTGFLLPNHRDDQAYQNELHSKIEAAVQNIDSAYSPWAISGKSSDKRRESLRGILQQVSDAGILLFTQPSTFLFDWSTPVQSDSRTVAISPALLRENEVSAREDVLIRGTPGKL